MILVIAAITLRNVRRRVKLAEYRIECLREEQARLLAFLREEREILQEESKRERERHLETQRREERLSRECSQLRQKQGQLVEELERERVKYMEAQQRTRQEREERELEHRARRDAEQRIDQLERELLERRSIQQDREVQREISPPAPEGLKDLPGAREPLEKKTLQTQRAQEAGRTPRPASSLDTTAAPKPAEVPPKDKKPRLGVWHPHPDDDVSRREASAGQARAQSDAPVNMFRKHYDKYLENYQGYVELAERFYRMRNSGQVTPGSLEEREWEERLRRVNDGIERTTARLDLLEEYNPELATDDRISYRAGLAQRHSELLREAGEADA